MVFLNIIFIITSLQIYKVIEGKYNLAMVIISSFYAILNGISIYLIFLYNKIEFKEDFYYYKFCKIPNQNFLKTLDRSYFDKDSYLLVSIVLSNHEELIKAFDELFFYKIMNEIYDRFKAGLKDKNVIISNNIRKIMLIVETNKEKEVLDVITSLLEERVVMESIPIELEYYLGYSLNDNVDNLLDRNLFFNCNIASKYAINNDIKVVSFNDIEESYQYDYNLLKLIPKAIENKELFFYYQPIIPVKKEEFLYLEMLIRWQKGDVIIMPNHFIPHVEKTLLIDDLSLYIIQEAIVGIKNYLEYGYKVAMSINVAAKNLESDFFVKEAVKMIKESLLSPRHFEFEITEGSAINFSDKLIENILVLKEIGVKVSIDDFGSGFSNLGYFNKMPIDYVKTDKVLSKNINKDENANRLIKNLILMFHELGYGVVCEGVETEDQLEFLQKTGIDYLQGYHISKPLSNAGVKEWVINNYKKYVLE